MLYCFLYKKSGFGEGDLIGGEYQKESQVNVGPLVKQVISEFYVDKLFVGIDGFDLNRGFTGSDITRCDTTRTLATAAKHTIVLTDSSKFTQKWRGI